MRCSARAAPHVEQCPVAAHEVDALVVVHPAERRLRAGGERHAGVARQVACLDELDDTLRRTARRSIVAVDLELDEPGPAGSLASSLRYSSAWRPTMLAFSRSGRSLVTTVTSWPSSAEVLRHGEDAMVVVVRRTARREPGCVLVVELDAQRAAGLVGGDASVSEPCACGSRSSMRSAAARGPAELGMVALGLEL